MNLLYRRFLKRWFDFFFALFAIILLTPILLAIGLLVKLSLGAPILFIQERPGKDEKIFKLYKFRTLSNSKNDDGQLKSDQERMTKVGLFLRKTSLDELPELFNILNGDMSVVGPRPLLIEYLPLYNPEQKKRHLIRPGLTGLAQIKGRNRLSWEEKFHYDLEYIDKISFGFDLKIIVQTVIKVVKREDIIANNSVTSEKFKGSSDE